MRIPRAVVKSIEEAARILGMQLQLVPADSPDDIANAFSAMAKDHPGAFIVMPRPMLFGEHRRIDLVAKRAQLPPPVVRRRARLQAN
jgi:DNA-binding LacI/PurR family transcriptional regulator